MTAHAKCFDPSHAPLQSCTEKFLSLAVLVTRGPCQIYLYGVHCAALHNLVTCRTNGQCAPLRNGLMLSTPSPGVHRCAELRNEKFRSTHGQRPGCGAL